MFKKNLKYYRLKKNMTKKQLAEACNVSSMTISNYESGNRTPDMEIIKLMANVLGVRVVDFLASRNNNLDFHHGEFRKKSTLTKGEQEYVRECVEEYFSRFFDAVEFLGGNPLPEPICSHKLGISGDAEKDAIMLRKYLGMPESGPIDELVGMLENKGIMVLQIEIGNDKFSGMNGTVNRYPYIVINKGMRLERKRTTIVHELAHQMFDWDNQQEAIDVEKYATMIAGAFLIPGMDILRELGQRRAAVTQDMTITCKEYGISTYLLVKRATQQGIISKNVEKEFYIKANKCNWRIKEPNMVKWEEEPKLFEQLVYRAINEEGISIQRGSELLNKPYDEVEKFCGLMEVSGERVHQQ